MKTIFRNLAFGVLMTGVAVVSGTTAYAQDVCTEVEAKQALYKQFTDNYAGNVTQMKTAVTAGEQYVSKYGACADDKAIVDYLNANLPTIKTKIDTIEKGERQKALFNRFDTAVKGTNKVANPSETYAAGKEIVALNNDLLLDILLVLGSVGLEQATLTPAVDTYNNDAIEYAKQAIQKLEANTPSKTKNYGVLQYSYKDRDNALNWMNYNIGYIMYYRQNKKKEALPYFYKATKYTSENQKNPFLYQTIGAWYLDEAIRIDKERTAAITAAGNKDTDATLAMLAEQKGYADRAIDAYARAYKLAKDDKNQKKEYVDGLYTRLTELYKFRYDNKTEGINEFVATVMNKPFPDPTTAITPVKEEPAPTTTPASNTSNSGTTSTTPAMNTTTKPVTTPVNNTTKPATTTKPVSTTTTTTEADKTAATKTSTTKKPTPKKKGTR